MAKSKKKPMAEDEAYCVKCKAPRVMENAKDKKMKNGRPARSGTCGKCGTKMFKILPTS